MRTQVNFADYKFNAGNGAVCRSTPSFDTHLPLLQGSLTVIPTRKRLVKAYNTDKQKKRRRALIKILHLIKTYLGAGDVLHHYGFCSLRNLGRALSDGA